LVLILVSVLQAQKRDKDPSAGFPRSLLHAQFVYVTSMTGGQFKPSTYEEDRVAIGEVQDAIQQWGRYTLVYKPEDADLIFNVRAGRHLEGRAGVGVTSGSGVPAAVGEVAGGSVGPADDYMEALMPIPAERLDVSHATLLWRRTQHDGFGDGAPLVQEFRKEAEAAAAHDAESKKKH
jgi:hypothetical protein